MDNKPDILAQKKGYLEDNYRIFYLNNKETKEYENHYHDFDKLLFFIKGDVRYTIEGKAYDLIPNDIVLVPHGDVHKVEIREGVSYERIVMYLSPQYLEQERNGNSAMLGQCFYQAKERYSHVVRERKGHIAMEHLAEKLKHSLQDTEQDEWESIYQETLLVQFLICLNRALSQGEVLYVDTSKCNDKMVEIIRYINEHLTEDISIDMLSRTFYLSKFYMMRQFKNETGYTMGTYISNKRLLYARELIQKGETITKACFDCGFKDYSTFSRNYKQLFGVTASKSRD